MFQKQPMMRKVLYALAPIALWSIYLYGWRSLAIILVSVIAGVLTEYLYLKYTDPKKKVTEAVLVSSVLYAMGMPPALPLWMVPVGIILAVILAKMVFGGFGRNLFNPAITGRALMYLIFSGPMTSRWFTPGNFGMNFDGTASPTPLMQVRSGVDPSSLAGADNSWWTDLLLGLHSSSVGEGAIVLILLGAIYLLVTNTASWRLMLSGLIGFLIPSILFGPQVLNVETLSPAIDPVVGTFSGSFLFVCVFMLTDPVSAPKKRPSLWLYGIIFGLVTVLVRYFAPSFPEGTSFGILIANVFAPWIDEFFPKAPNAVVPIKKKAKKTVAPAAAQTIKA
ncbi:RnfABCDGE type electron transport complex subunit D [Candidatus Haliotispira prima]|uniref:RnfABCDGE type electron transport complex subunit D n=1 Tax=Candidatus Haliotispira prima TaxID=3034016 RepID=A0ABY8MG99_9SPIO|nr:RnfABCDGE type electron transport complex subunit D [Candidatus Haliotispira prima]